LLLLLLSSSLLINVGRAQDTEDDAPIKVDTVLLTMPLTVSDRSGRNIPGLKKENFSIFQDGIEQDIEYFFNEETPMNVAVLIDTSASTKEVLDKIQKAARDFVKILRPEDKGIIVGFDYQTLFLSDLTSDRKKLSNAISQTRIADQAGSDMNEAIFNVVKNHFSSFKGRKAVIVLSDGMVMRRALSTQQTLDTLQKSDTVFYPIIFNTKFSAQSRASAAANKTKPLSIKMLEFLAEETGGSVYEKDAANLKEAFEGIAAEMKKQYLLGFYPQKTEKGKSSGYIRIAVDRKDLAVKTKKKWDLSGAN
ncbi:MAG TPA: VWA domain-containing protein, partial [Pyrinomonadaceae bacterium]|nr:VWA domain-containing protein [Pyrinomonadaceae bacterium]